ncbi:hypothetical protein B0H19DRAFT_183238 [Mycena capillaripes]|nr:hypothetical protein B0H19DRAFT_183238 [Mycena capillaripes]
MWDPNSAPRAQSELESTLATSLVCAISYLAQTRPHLRISGISSLSRRCTLPVARRAFRDRKGDEGAHIPSPMQTHAPRHHSATSHIRFHASPLRSSSSMSTCPSVFHPAPRYGAPTPPRTAAAHVHALPQPRRRLLVRLRRRFPICSHLRLRIRVRCRGSHRAPRPLLALVRLHLLRDLEVLLKHRQRDGQGSGEYRDRKSRAQVNR